MCTQALEVKAQAVSDPGLRRSGRVKVPGIVESGNAADGTVSLRGTARYYEVRRDCQVLYCNRSDGRHDSMVRHPPIPCTCPPQLTRSFQAHDKTADAPSLSARLSIFLNPSFPVRRGPVTRSSHRALEFPHRCSHGLLDPPTYHIHPGSFRIDRAKQRR